MKVYFDHPAGLWRSPKGKTEETRFAFEQLSLSLLKGDLPFETFERRPGLHRLVTESMTDGVYYAYHTEEPGQNTFCFKRGPLPFLWHMDPCGYSGWAEIAVNPEAQEEAAKFDLRRARAIIDRYRQDMQASNLSLLKQPNRDENPLPDTLRDFVFYPLQVNEDMVMKLARIPQYEAIRTAAKLAGEHGRDLALKRHPLCTSGVIDTVLEEVADLPNVYISEASVNTLLEQCRAVLVTNSSVGLHALIWGRPVFTVGRSEYAHMTYPITKSEQIAEVFESTPEPVSERCIRQLGHLLEVDLVDIRDSARILSRVTAHLQSINSGDAEKPADHAIQFDDDTRRHMSFLHDLDRKAREELDLLLWRYGSRTEQEREPLRNTLAGLARRDAHMDHIIQRTDPLVALKCLRYFQTQGDKVRMKRVVQMQRKQPPASTGQLFPYARWLFQNGFSKTAVPLLEKTGERRSLTDGQLRFISMALLKSEPALHARAQDLAERAIGEQPDAAANHYCLARVAWERGNAPLARKAAAEALRLDPVHKGAQILQERLPPS